MGWTTGNKKAQPGLSFFALLIERRHAHMTECYSFKYAALVLGF
jgi:hypothetical protein